MSQTVDNEILEKVVNELAEIKVMLTRSMVNENSKELWTKEQVASYLNFSPRHIDAISIDPDFPRPVRLPSQRDVKKGSSKILYLAGEIVRYAYKKKEKL